MSPCSNLPEYTPLVSHADCMSHEINRVEMCEVLDEVYEKLCIGKQISLKFLRVLKDNGSLKKWQTCLLHSRGATAMNTLLLRWQYSCQQLFFLR